MFLVLIVIFDCLCHLLVRLHNQRAHIIAVLAVVDLAGIPACLIVKVGTAADRADLDDLFRFHEKVIDLIRIESFGTAGRIASLGHALP